jgi:DNA-binding beta-propeller fold protein YncE
VYVADTGNDRIQKFSSSGNLLGTIDGSAAGEGQFAAPTGVAVTSTGSVVIAAGARLVVLDEAGHFDRELIAPEIASPGWVDVAVDGDDTVFALDAVSGRIAVFRPDGSSSTFGGTGSGDGQLLNPTGLAVRNATIAVADAGSARIAVFDAAGAFLEAIPVAEWVGAEVLEADVAIDESGTIWASSPATNAVLIYRPDGTFSRTISSVGAELLDRPSGLALRPGGWLFVANAGGNRVSLLGFINP